MNTFKIICLLLVCLFQYSLAVVPSSFQPGVKSPSETSNLVKAVRFNGKWIPVVDLPVIEITALKKSHTVLGITPGKPAVLQANLPQVEITATAVTTGRQRTGCSNEGAVIMADLPVIEVVADFPESNLIATSTGNIPVVTLPEITISGTPQGQLTAAVETSPGTVSPLVNLPEVIINESGNRTTGSPYLFSVKHRLGYFLVDQGRSKIESMIRSFIF